MKKVIKRKSLFTEDEIKETTTAIKVENNKAEHSSATVAIEERQIICKKCDAEFSSNDTSCFECFAHADRVVIYCPKCLTMNKIKKELTMTRFRRNR